MVRREEISGLNTGQGRVAVQQQTVSEIYNIICETQEIVYICH